MIRDKGTLRESLGRIWSGLFLWQFFGNKSLKNLGNYIHDGTKMRKNWRKKLKYNMLFLPFPFFQDNLRQFWPIMRRSRFILNNKTCFLDRFFGT